MAVILKVKIKRQVFPDKTHYEYPPEYDAKKIQVLCYESIGEPHMVEPRDTPDPMNSHEYCIGVVSDADAPQFLASPDIKEIQEAEAKQKGRRWRPQVEKILDQTRVISILAKVARHETLTQEEEDAINPDHPALGINKSRHFDDLLDEYTAKL